MTNIAYSAVEARKLTLEGSKEGPDEIGIDLNLIVPVEITYLRITMILMVLMMPFIKILQNLTG